MSFTPPQVAFFIVFLALLLRLVLPPVVSLWAFAVATARITSGSIAKRIQFISYLIHSSFPTSLVYPIDHWFWSPDRWASPARVDNNLFYEIGVLDFAGFGVVHMVGGIASLWGAFIVGSRIGRFNHADQSCSFTWTQQYTCCSRFILLWFGWYDSILVPF
ncbi:hypothetical protein Patl1_01667 [Pistacia atlantica]|uniref:Uncharacterized protein n=1 Tax=Pistacia atlantica TaxID=434234 RepID=A0ACC1C5N4_9ROSI|nr:hypothetical protein Patl1_01667 [Pistacia atlantica]